MPANTPLEYVKMQINHEISNNRARKRFNMRLAFLFTVIPATLAAFATVAIGASQKFDNDWLSIAAMIATGIASIFSAWEALFSHRQMWRLNNLALAGYYELKSDIEFRESDDGTITLNEAESFFDRLKQIRKEAEDGYQRAVVRE